MKVLGALQLPSQKEWGAGIGGLLAFGIIAGCNHFGYPLGDETNSLLVVVLPALVAKIVPPSAQDILTHVNDAIVEAGVIAGKLTPPEQIVAADPSNTLVLKPAQLVSVPGAVPQHIPEPEAGAGVAPSPPLAKMSNADVATVNALLAAAPHYQPLTGG